MIGAVASWLLGSGPGRWILVAGGAAIALGVAWLWIRHSAYEAGAAGAAAAAAAEGLRRTARAQQARAGIKPNDHGAMDADPFNRDRR